MSRPPQLPGRAGSSPTPAGPGFPSRPRAGRASARAQHTPRPLVGACGGKGATRGSRRPLRWRDARRCLRGGDSSGHLARFRPELAGSGGGGLGAQCRREGSAAPRRPRARAGARRVGPVLASSRPAARAPRPPRPRARPAPAPAPVRGQPGAGPAAVAGERRAGHGPAAGGGGRLRVAEGARRARRCARSQRGPSPRLQRPGPAAAERAAISAPHCARPSGRRCPGAMR